jgi:hypothetical protein
MALTATSRVISITTPDNPFGIEIRDSNNKVIGKDDIINVDIDDLNAFIIIDVLPLMTKNSNINPPKIEEGSVGDVEIVRRGDTNRYSVIPKKVGPVKVVISAAANVNVTRAVVFNITSNSIESLVVFDSDGNALPTGGSVIKLNHSSQLYLEIYPIEALKEDIVSWRVTDGEKNISITPNGYLTINSRSKEQSVVRAMAKDKNNHQPYVELVFDTSGAIIKDKNVYVEEENANPEYIKEVFTLDPENSEVTIKKDAKGELIATVTHEDQETHYITKETMRVVIAKANDWGFIEGPSLLYTNNTPYFLGAKDLLTGKKIEKGVTFTADPAKATIDKETGAMFPLVPGELVVTAKKGREEKQIIFNVKERVPTFELELGIEDAMLGIQLTRKWGHYWLDENYALTNQHRFGLSNKNHTFDVKWDTSDSSVVNIEAIEGSKDIMLTFHEEGAGKSAVISATFMLYNRPVEQIKRSFEFKLMDTPDYINITKFDELWHMSIEEEYNACLQSDIIATKQIVFNLGISFYGNGFLYDASAIPYFIPDTGAINVFRKIVDWDKYPLERPKGKELVDNGDNPLPIHFEEMRMRNVETMVDVDMVKRGAAIKLVRIYAGLVSFKYMQIFNTDLGVRAIYTGQLSFEGCILGDNATFSIFISPPDLLSFRRTTLRLKNNVIKNSNGPGITILFGGDFTMESMAAGYMPEITIEGFLDIYNWHTDRSFAETVAKVGVSALSEFTNSDQGLVDFLESILADYFYDYISNSKLNHLYYVHNRTKYISLGIFTVGMLFNTNTACITNEDSRLVNLAMPIVDENGEVISESMSNLATLMEVVAPGKFELKYDSILTCHDFSDGKEPEVKPGDPVPQTYELYARLTGKSADLYE